MQYISQNIRTLRKARGITQEELASALHVTRQAVSSWERGGSCPDFNTLRIMAEVLEASPEQLLSSTFSGKRPRLKKVHYGLAMLLSLVFAILSFFILQFVGLAFFFVLLIPFCTCCILDEIRNGECYRLYGEAYQEEEESEPIEPIV